MTMPGEEDNSILRHLIAACKDAEHGYRTAAQYAGPQELKSTLLDCAEQRARYAAELQVPLDRWGHHSETSGTIGGALQQGWAAIKSALTGGNEKAHLAECERHEEEASKQYEEALQQHLSADARALVLRQLQGIQEACARLRTLQSATS